MKPCISEALLTHLSHHFSPLETHIEFHIGLPRPKDLPQCHHSGSFTSVLLSPCSVKEKCKDATEPSALYQHTQKHTSHTPIRGLCCTLSLGFHPACREHLCSSMKGPLICNALQSDTLDLWVAQSQILEIDLVSHNTMAHSLFSLPVPDASPRC